MAREDAAKSPARSVKQPDERRDEIVAASRALFAERGIGKTSISHIADRVGITRGLVYHYFGDKDAIVDVVLEEYIEEFVARVRQWDAEREAGNIDKALVDCIALFRHQLDDRDPLRDDLHRPENAGLYSVFVDRAVTAVVDCIRLTTVEAYAARHRIEIDSVYETFYVLVYGLIGLTRSRPDVEDRVLIGIVRQTLHLEHGPTRIEGD